MNSNSGAQPLSTDVLVVGEALVDVVTRAGQTSEHAGGSPLNVAAGLARLGHRTHLATWFGRDQRGALIRTTIDDAGVVVVEGSDAAARTPVADAQVDDEGRASYQFDLDWQVPDLAELDQFGHVHTGSFAATLAPGADAVAGIIDAVASTASVSYDPNVRPSLMGSPEQVSGQIENLIRHADVVKASDEDLAWLYPDQPVEQVMRRWAAMGPALVVTTRGPWGAYAVLGHQRDLLVVDQMTVELADTVGAGDSFMAGLLSGLFDAGLLGSREAVERLRQAGWNEVQSALHRAVITSGLTVSRAGAHAPDRDEVRAVVLARPELA